MTISEEQKIRIKIENIITDLMSYGYSREEILVDIEKEDSETVWDVRREYYDLLGQLKGIELLKKEILDMINKERDEGNMVNMMTNGEKFIDGFSPALCLSNLIKFLEKNND